jgi:hypothetical protein
MYKLDEERFAAVNALTAERARSAALEAKLEQVHDIADAPWYRGHEDFIKIAALSQSPTPTEKKT